MLFKQIQPKFISTINLYNQVKTQTEVSKSINKQLSIAKEKVERKKKLRMLDTMTKKIYEPSGNATDSESTFAVLLDDVIEMARRITLKLTLFSLQLTQKMMFLSKVIKHIIVLVN